MSVAPTGVALTGNTSGPESEYRVALNRNNQWRSRLQILTRALAAAPLVLFDRRDDLQDRWLREQGISGSEAPRHYVPASHDFAQAVGLGFGWGLLPGFQSDAGLESRALVRLGGPPIDVPLYWQQWNLRSPLLDAVAAEIVEEGRRVLRPAPSLNRR